MKKILVRVFLKSKSRLIDLSITPNRPDCLGVRGIARDLAASGFGQLVNLKAKQLRLKTKQNLKVKLIRKKIRVVLLLEVA